MLFLRSLLAFVGTALLATAAAAATPVAANMLLLDGCTAGAAVVVVGERGSILRSTDSGRTWQAQPSGTGATLTAIAFAADGLHGWAVGHDALILGTSDGGATWQQAWQGPDLTASFLDVCALDAGHAIAVGAYGLLLQTHDGGKTWSAQRLSEDDLHFNRISRGPTGTLYLAGERGSLFRSLDRGTTWTRLEPPYDGSFYGLLPLGPQELLAHGLRGHVYRSGDDGATWTPLNLDQPVLIACAVRTPDGRVLLAGQAHAFYLGSAGTVGFTAWHPNFSAAVAELVLTPDGTVLALGENGATRLPAP